MSSIPTTMFDSAERRLDDGVRAVTSQGAVAARADQRSGPVVHSLGSFVKWAPGPGPGGIGTARVFLSAPERGTPPPHAADSLPSAATTVACHAKEAPQPTNEIGAVAVVSDDDDRYPKEILKTLISFLFMFLCVFVNMMSLVIVHERMPDRAVTPRLPDTVLDLVAAHDWGLPAAEYLIMFSTTCAMAVVVCHKHRFIVARRLSFIIGLLYLYRSLTIFVTVVPISSTTYYCSPKATNATTPLSPLLVLRRTFYIISGFGLSINGHHTYCGDYIYSGHTMVLVLSYLVVAEYSPRRLWGAHWLMAALAALGVAFVLLAHGHYTVDVVIAYYVTTRLFWSVHALAAGGGARQQHWLRRDWWFPLWAYLERNVRGPVPRRYDLPLPWPRAKLFSRMS